MPLTLTTVTPPTAEPLLLQEAKDHLRVDSDDENAEIARLIQAARVDAEGFLNRRIARATLRLKLDQFPGAYRSGYCRDGLTPWIRSGVDAIRPPSPPLVSVTSITYVDTNGDTQTLDADAYRVDSDSEPGRITPAYGTCWPATRCETNAVTITYIAGYATTAEELAPDQVRRCCCTSAGTTRTARPARASGARTSRSCGPCGSWRCDEGGQACGTASRSRQRASGQSASGAANGAWSTWKTVWAEVVPLAGRERLQANLAAATH
jgi:uncharacterized phiE125 gp8 family phage protein